VADGVERDGRGRDVSMRRGEGSYRRYQAARRNAADFGSPPALFAHQKTPTADMILLALARYPALSPKQLSRVCDVDVNAVIARLQVRGLVCRSRSTTGHMYAVALDGRHAGAEHLRAYVLAAGRARDIPHPGGHTPVLDMPPGAFPAMPAPLFFERTRTEVLLALSLVPEMPVADLGSICARTNNEGTMRGVLSLWRAQKLISTRRMERDRRFRYVSLNRDFPGMEHLRLFLAATANAYERRLLLKTRAVLFWS
jgi:hypothetical protein